MSYNEKKPCYRFAGNDGSKPIQLQDGRVYDLNGNSLDSAFAADDSAENLIQWLWNKNFCITPEARALIIKEKKRVALERQTEALIRRNEQLVREETERMEMQLAESEKVMRDEVELHLKKPERQRVPLTLTAAEEAVLGPGRTVAAVPEAPALADLIPDELNELAAVIQPKRKRG